MRNGRLWIFAAGALAGCLALGMGGAEGSGRGPVHGDFNCNSQVDAGDALGLLLDVSDTGTGGNGWGCLSAEGFDARDKDVNCDGVTDVGDVITITRNLGGLEDEAIDCPHPGDDVGAPLMNLRCEEIAEPLAVRCQYDIWDSEHEIVREFDGADGEVEIVVESSSVGCDPGPTNCHYAYAGEVIVRFAGHGEREISVTGCDDGLCARRVVTIWF
jgi:hypothetical protein